MPIAQSAHCPLLSPAPFLRKVETSVNNYLKIAVMQVTYNNETEDVEYDVSEMRLNPTYIRWYTFSYILHPTLTLTVGPVIVVTLLNYNIYR